MKKSEKVSFTVSRWAALAGIDRHAVQRGIEDIAAVPVGKATGQGHNAPEYAIKDLFRASHGDLDGQKLRKLVAESERLEFINAKNRGEYMPTAECVNTVIQCGWDIRKHILSMPIPHRDQDLLILGMRKLIDVWQARADAENPGKEQPETTD